MDTAVTSEETVHSLSYRAHLQTRGNEPAVS